MYECDKCKETNSEFHFKQKNYAPADFIEGNDDSLIWIVGLNPKKTNDPTSESRTKGDLKDYFQQKPHSYFNTFKSVSTRLHSGFGMKMGVAHTDIVKCSSHKFPTGAEAKTIVNNCSGYLKDQIAKHKPKMLICNGIAVSTTILDFLPPPESFNKYRDTSYVANIEGSKIRVILSGFVKYIDNYSRQRLGNEIEKEWDAIEKEMAMIHTATEIIIKNKSIENSINNPISLL